MAHIPVCPPGHARMWRVAVSSVLVLLVALQLIDTVSGTGQEVLLADGMVSKASGTPERAQGHEEGGAPAVGGRRRVLMPLDIEDLDDEEEAVEEEDEDEDEKHLDDGSNDDDVDDKVAKLNQATSRRELRGVMSLRKSTPRGSGFWSVKKANYYDAAGRRVWFSGVQWVGFEVDGCVHGLDVRNYKDHLSQMAQLGFNMLRLSFAGDTLLPSSHPTTINYGLNPDLQGLNSFQVMDKVITACAAYNIKVILDYHRMTMTPHPEYGLWWDFNHTENAWVANWKMLADKYKNNPTVIGADLFNEIHNNSIWRAYPVWAKQGVLEPWNWRSAVKRVSDAIQSVNPNIIIFVEGMWYNSWWGGNLKYFTKKGLQPIPLKIPHKLAYSAHEYGPNVFDQPWFLPYTFPNDAWTAFPYSLRPYWEDRWGYIVRRNAVPVWIGEWGSHLSTADLSNKTSREVTWAYRFRDYIRELQVSHTWFAWGPDAFDTGGILQPDWRTPWQVKLELLAPVMHPGFGPSPGQ
eukprot:TRINITY_DN21127_c0_g2_i1.p1 TRINITY_DN21127_c0_g2~~TRINITY_DN21127_c0_g2_i1.p1  ORF type:complete len:518 (-),score=65.46 TRINITY_DN21127_c0_g2_i1:98-1651(-)